jgi:hypothetical protein
VNNFGIFECIENIQTYPISHYYIYIYKNYNNRGNGEDIFPSQTYFFVTTKSGTNLDVKIDGKRYQYFLHGTSSETRNKIQTTKYIHS